MCHDDFVDTLWAYEDAAFFKLPVGIACEDHEVHDLYAHHHDGISDEPVRGYVCQADCHEQFDNAVANVNNRDVDDVFSCYEQGFEWCYKNGDDKHGNGNVIDLPRRADSVGGDVEHIIEQPSFYQ